MTKDVVTMMVSCDFPGCSALELIDMTKDGDYYTDAHINEDVRKFGWYAVEDVHYCPKHHPDMRKLLETGL